MKNSVIKKWICMVCGAAVIFSLAACSQTSSSAEPTPAPEGDESADTHTSVCLLYTSRCV